MKNGFWNKTAIYLLLKYHKILISGIQFKEFIYTTTTKDTGEGSGGGGVGVGGGLVLS